MKVKVLVTQSCPMLCDARDSSPSGLLHLWNFSGKNIGVGCHSFLQVIFLIQGSNPGLLHCRQILCHLNHQRSPNFFTNLAVTQLLGPKEFRAGTEGYLGRLMGINYQISAFLSIGFTSDFWTYGTVTIGRRLFICKQ